MVTMVTSVTIVTNGYRSNQCYHGYKWLPVLSWLQMVTMVTNVTLVTNGYHGYKWLLWLPVLPWLQNGLAPAADVIRPADIF